jgi:hypothetical protein
VEQLESKLKTESLHVGLLKGRSDVHVHVQETFHGTAKLSLFHLQLGQQLDEPLEGALVAVDPEKVDLRQG